MHCRLLFNNINDGMIFNSSAVLTLIILLMYNVRLLHERQKVDRRCIEDSFFQYAALRIASWYPEHFKLSALQLHAMTTTTINNMTVVYHGAFMKRYSGTFWPSVCVSMYICVCEYVHVCMCVCIPCPLLTKRMCA